MPAGASWIKPQGGLFVWLKLPDDLSTNELYPLAGEEKVTFAPGSLFYPGARHQPYMRLNFVANPADMIEEGVRRLGLAVERLMAHQQSDRQDKRIPTRSGDKIENLEV